MGELKKMLMEGAKSYTDHRDCPMDIDCIKMLNRLIKTGIDNARNEFGDTEKINDEILSEYAYNMMMAFINLAILDAKTEGSRLLKVRNFKRALGKLCPVWPFHGSDIDDLKENQKNG